MKNRYKNDGIWSVKRDDFIKRENLKLREREWECLRETEREKKIKRKK